MIDDLLNLAKSQLGEQLQQNVNLSSDQVEQTVGVAKDSFMKQMASEAMSGNLGDLLNIFNGNDSSDLSNPLVGRLASQFGGDLIEKLGFDSQMSDQIAKMVIPFVMNLFASDDTGKADDESSLMDKLGLDAGGIMGNILGGLFK